MPVEDPLTAPFAGLCDALRGLHNQVNALVRVHEAVDAFNEAFGAFQSAISLQASCLQFPQPPAPVAVPISRFVSKKPSVSLDKPRPELSPTGIPPPKTITKPSNLPVAGSGGKKSGIPQRQGPAASIKKKGVKVASTPGQRQMKGKKKPAAPAKKPTPPAWVWEKWVLEKVPKKYQSAQELKKLETIVLYIKNRRSGISIADLVKHSGLAVIKCKEILQTLMKLELIERKHEESGFVYTFGTSS